MKEDLYIWESKPDKNNPDIELVTVKKQKKYLKGLIKIYRPIKLIKLTGLLKGSVIDGTGKIYDQESEIKREWYTTFTKFETVDFKNLPIPVDLVLRVIEWLDCYKGLVGINGRELVYLINYEISVFHRWFIGSSNYKTAINRIDDWREYVRKYNTITDK